MDETADDTAESEVSLDTLLRLARDAENGCLLWTAGTCGSGLPQFSTKTKSMRVARRVYIAVYGPLAKPQWVVEAKCGNLRCIAPEHLHVVPQSKATRRLIGVPLPHGHTLKSAGYELVHRARGASIWEPKDIAIAIWAARGERCCVVCDGFIPRRGKMVCSQKCAHVRDRAKSRRTAGRPAPDDARFRIGEGRRPTGPN